MYHVNGAFGQVRMATILPAMQKKQLFSVGSIGWHKCNDLYHIDRPHGMSVYLILFTVNGCGYLRIQEQEYHLTPGTIALVPPDVSVAYKTPEDGLWEFYWMHPGSGMSHQFLDTIAENGIYMKKVENIHMYGQKTEEILSFCQGNPMDAALKISQKLSELFHELAITFLEPTHTSSLSDRAISYLERHCAEQISLDTVAAELYVSTAHLIRVFKKEVGCTPHQYLLRYRLTSATLLLKFSELRVDEIAQQVGFSSSSHLISLFRKQFGCTPVQYREQENRLQLSENDLLSDSWKD